MKMKLAKAYILILVMVLALLTIAACSKNVVSSNSTATLPPSTAEAERQETPIKSEKDIASTKPDVTEREENFVTPNAHDFSIIEITKEHHVFVEDNVKVSFEYIPTSEAEQVVASMLFYYATNDVIKREVMWLKPKPIDLNNPYVRETHFASFTILKIKTMSETDIKSEVRPAFATDSLATEGMFDGFLTIGEYIEEYKLIDPIIIMADEMFTFTEAASKRGPQLADNTTYRRYYIMSKNTDGAYRIADSSFVW